MQPSLKIIAGQVRCGSGRWRLRCSQARQAQGQQAQRAPRHQGQTNLLRWILLRSILLRSILLQAHLRQANLRQANRSPAPWHRWQALRRQEPTTRQEPRNPSGAQRQTWMALNGFAGCSSASSPNRQVPSRDPCARARPTRPWPRKTLRQPIWSYATESWPRRTPRKGCLQNPSQMRSPYRPPCLAAAAPER